MVSGEGMGMGMVSGEGMGMGMEIYGLPNAALKAAAIATPGIASTRIGLSSFTKT